MIEGCIQRIDRTGLDVVAVEDPKLVLPQHTQWNVFAAFGKRLVGTMMRKSICYRMFELDPV